MLVKNWVSWLKDNNEIEKLYKEIDSPKGDQNEYNNWLKKVAKSNYYHEFISNKLKAGEKATYIMTFYLDPEIVNDPSVKNLHDVTMSYTFFSTDYYKQS